MLISVYTDGASRNNPGKSASGYAAFDGIGRLLFKKSFYNGIRTNNEAEYLAIIGALGATADKYGYGVDIILYSDSQLAVRQLKGSYKVKVPELKKLHSEATALLKKFRSFALNSVPRENPHITEVDAGLNLLLDRHEKGI